MLYGGEELKNNLKKLRGDKKQKEIAEPIGITISYYGMIENGLRTPSLELAKKLSDHFKVPIDKIFFGD